VIKVMEQILKRNVQQSLVAMVIISICPSTKFNVHIIKCFSWALWARIKCYVIRFRELHKEIKHDKTLI
jgi:hypothetical protein